MAHATSYDLLVKIWEERIEKFLQSGKLTYQGEINGHTLLMRGPNGLPGYLEVNYEDGHKEIVPWKEL